MTAKLYSDENKPMYGGLNSAITEANIPLEIHKVKSNIDRVSIDLNILNTNNQASTVRIAITKNDNVSLKDYIEYDVSVPANGVLLRNNIKCGPNERIVILSSLSNIVARVSGYEGL